MAMAPSKTPQSVAAPRTPELVPLLEARNPDVADSHASAVRLMFDRISPTYDLLNRLLSLGIDRRWRARALAELTRALPTGPLVDLCAGTLDLSVAMQARWPGRTLLSLDFARDMLLAGRGKLTVSADSPTQCIIADAKQLPLASQSIAGVICGFGVRNVSDPRSALREMARVLKPGGVCVVLEFFRPSNVLTHLFHAVYGGLMLPLVGRLVSGDAQAYSYLSRSMQGFMSRREFEQALRDAGFDRVESQDLSLGIASIVRGVRGAC